VPYCTTNAVATAVSAPGSAASSKAEWRSFAAAKNYAWGKAIDVHAGIVRKSFDYYNPAFEKTSEVDMGWQAGGSAGITSGARDQLYAIGFDFQKGYKAAKTRVVCPDGSISPVECLQGAFAPPSHAIGRLLWVETRNSMWHFPFGIRLTRDLAEKETGVDIPIYLVRNAGGDFDGGLRMGWTSSDHFQAGIFVGSDFDIPAPKQ
jgi:hypothetical protein